MGMVLVDALLENCVFYISRMYEFLHSQGQKRTKLLRPHARLCPLCPQKRTKQQSPRDVRFVLKADIRTAAKTLPTCDDLFDHLIGARQATNRFCVAVTLAGSPDHPCFATRLGGVSGGKELLPGTVRRAQIDGRAACRTEMKGQRGAAFSCPHPRCRLTGEGDLLAAEARLVADHGAGSALALQAVAHIEMRDGSPSIVR